MSDKVDNGIQTNARSPSVDNPTIRYAVESKPTQSRTGARRRMSSALRIKASNTIETLIKQNVIPDLYNQFGPGMVGRRGRTKSALAPSLREALNKQHPHHYWNADWFSRPEDVEMLFDVLRRDNDLGALDILRRVYNLGTPFVDICQGLITQTMVLVNSEWENDNLSFVEVTLLSDRLKRILREFASSYPPRRAQTPLADKALITTLPGEFHTIGAQIISHNLAANGWVIDTETPCSAHDIYGIIRRKWFTLIGISVTTRHLAKYCRRLTDDIRAHSRNPDVIVMIGGQAIQAEKTTADTFGADVIAENVKHALYISAHIEKAVAKQTRLDCFDDGRLIE